MKKLNTISEFKVLKDLLIADSNPDFPTIVISAGTCGQASGANDLIRSAKREILAKGLTEKIGLRITGCQGFCEMEPSILVEPARTFYPKVKPEHAGRIVQAVVNGEVIEELLYADPKSEKRIEKQDDIPFFSKQVRTLIGASEKIDPIRIYNYIENGGYSPLCQILESSDPSGVLRQVKTSGLRGRGGAGFPTGLKWEILAGQPNTEGKYLVCNADEGDPGAYMDRSLLEGNPHAIIEGMIIGAYATGADKGVVYVRNEYPLAIKHLIIALRQARMLGLLGENILGTDFSFDLELVKGAGAFVCGEETALIRSIEGRMGEPRQRPPYPVERGIHGAPTAINNVETWANVPVIMAIGAEEFAKIGTAGNSGTKIFSLVGKIRNTGLVEVPMGMTIREIVYDIGGGPINGGMIKAVQTGGPSGGCIPESSFDLPIDFESLAEAGSIMGSGGMIVMDQNTCIIDIAKYFMNFLKDESCGKCFTCRKGTQRMHEIYEDISNGDADLDELSLLEELAGVVKDTTMCGLGQNAANPVLSTLKFFRNEYITHVVNKRCTALACSDLVGAPCQYSCPVGTEAWRYIALIEKGDLEGAYRVIREPNPFPSVCSRICNHPCEYNCRLGTSGDDPVAIRTLKRYVTDNVSPAVYRPYRYAMASDDSPKIAIIGAGPSGLTAAHYLSLLGYKSIIYEADSKPGGMLLSCIPEYRLPKEIIEREIETLLDENITIKFNVSLGKDITVAQLQDEGYAAIYLAFGAHRSWKLGLAGEDAEGVHPSIYFLKEFNLRDKHLAVGHVGVIGGGNSAIDAARTALRQKDVTSVTILYRRTRKEMPAYDEEIEAAIEEGVGIKMLVTVSELTVEDGRISAITYMQNELGNFDKRGRRKPIPIDGSEFSMPIDTLIVATGQHPDLDFLLEMGISLTDGGRTIVVDSDTLACENEGIFAGGDVVTGSNTVIDAIAAGKLAARKIDRFVSNLDLNEKSEVRLPDVYIPPPEESDEESDEVGLRVRQPEVPVDCRRNNFVEVEKVINQKMASLECRRCLRCDLEFTRLDVEETVALVSGEK